MSHDEALANIQRQNDVIIGLLARLIWTPEKLAEMVSRGKRSPQAYRKVYNALDGIATGKRLASLASVSQPVMAVALKAWHELGIVVNAGTDTQPRYKRLMAIPAKDPKKVKANTNEK
jgi:hypothetical protein